MARAVAAVFMLKRSGLKDKRIKGPPRAKVVSDGYELGNGERGRGSGRGSVRGKPARVLEAGPCESDIGSVGGRDSCPAERDIHKRDVD